MPLTTKKTTIMNDANDYNRQPLTDAQTDGIAPGTDPRLDAYVIMALRRRNRPEEPDLDAEWQRFSRSKMRSDRRKYIGPVLRPLLCTVAGAAAMLAFILMFYGNPFTASRPLAAVVSTRSEKSAAPAAKGHVTPAIANIITPHTALPHAATAPVVVAQRGANPGRMQHVSTHGGMDLRVLLADGTEIWLNAGSSIDFPSSFQGPHRQVRLSGEAYFKVAHNEHKPFIVSTDRMSVRVLGTEFNFKSYSAEPQHVTLLNGRVEVLSPETNASAATLSPGEEALCASDGSIHIQQADTYAATQWVKGYFYFHDTPLVDVLRDLGRWYDLGVVFHNRAAMDFKVHFSALRNAAVDDALESLNRLKRFCVRIENGNICVY